MAVFTQQVQALTQQKSLLPPELEPLLPADVTPDERQAVADWLQVMGIEGDANGVDPFATTAVFCASHRLFLEKQPDQIKAAIAGIFAELDARMAAIDATAARKVEQREMEMRDKLAGQLNPPLSPLGILGNTVALGLTLAVGLFGGYQITAKQPLDPRGPVQLTLAQYELLALAESPEGQRALQLLEWNEDLISGDCERAVRNSGASFYFGNQVVQEGFCFAWVVPPERRKYRDVE